MNIKDFERATGVARTTIRHYESLGLLSPKHVKASNGYRSYGPEEVERVNTIRAAQSLGFSLADAADLIGQWNRGGLDAAARRRAVERRCEAIVARRKEIGRLLIYLRKILQWIVAGGKGAKPVFAPVARNR